MVAAAAAAAAAGGVWLVQATAVGTATGQRVDQAVMVAAAGVPGLVGRLTAALLDHLGPAEVAGVLAVLAVVVLRRGVPRAGSVAAGVLLGADLTTQLLKATLARPDLGLGTSGSLPSGHVTFVAALAVAGVLVAAPRWRVVVGALGAVAVALTAVAVLVQQWHRPSDVVAALLVVAGWVPPARLALRRRRTDPILVPAAPGGR
ncbi:hypothetical protein GCM10027047_20600 [Rhodococcus aerolatus]